MFRVILTGVNRGLGKDILRIILKDSPDYQVIGTARSNTKQLQQEINKEFPKNNVQILELDLSKQESINNFVKILKQKNFNFDCLINNAAVGCDNGPQLPSVEVAISTLLTNVTCTIQLTNKLLPLLKQNGRIINVSSKLGALRFHGKDVVEKYSDQKITLQQIQKEITNYIEGCKQNNVGAYFKSAYGTSKMMLNAWSRFILKNQLKNGQVVVSMSPGHCKTDMGGPHAMRTSYQGAQSIYNHIKGERSSNIFYHIDKVSDFMDCGPHS